MPGYAVRLYDAYLDRPQLVRLATWARLERTPPPATCSPRPMRCPRPAPSPRPRPPATSIPRSTPPTCTPWSSPWP
ncbi:hypothetical protein [Nonomuraea salmonea]|uniref:hypothetical protein n=1 Tax=Nonomuraea salmonea TaxID=46181 RepID=UPI0031EEB868